MGMRELQATVGRLEDELDTVDCNCTRYERVITSLKAKGRAVGLSSDEADELHDYESLLHDERDTAARLEQDIDNAYAKMEQFL